MAITPNSSIYFCNVPWGSDYTHVCDIAGLSTILVGTPLIKLVSDYTYVRKDSTINVSVPMDELIGANYVMYKNANHENKWFYAFIESMEYKSDNATAVKIRTDVYQTWRGDMTIPACFVVREHTNNDTIGNNTIEENLETGDYIINSAFSDAGLDSLAIVVAVSEEPGTGALVEGGMYNGVYSGVKFYGSTNPAAVTKFLISYNDKGKAEAVLSVFMCPNDFVNVAFNTVVDPVSQSALGSFKAVSAPARPATIDGYTPRNKKLLTYPYQFLYVHNNSGGSAVYKYELFNTTPAFTVYGAVAPNPVFKMIPSNIKTASGTSNDQDQGLTIGGFPLCAWITDPYKNWIAQNAGSTTLGLIGGAGALIAGVATGGTGLLAMSAMAGGAMSVLNQVAQIEQRKIQPNQANGQMNSGSANTAVTWNDFFLYAKSIRSEYARIIDEYFDMYGYKTSRVKVPNLTGRATWNYVQTIDAIVKGGIPETDRVQLQKIFNDGVTIWHTLTNFGDYTQANAIS